MSDERLVSRQVYWGAGQSVVERSDSGGNCRLHLTSEKQYYHSWICCWKALSPRLRRADFGGGLCAKAAWGRYGRFGPHGCGASAHKSLQGQIDPGIYSVHIEVFCPQSFGLYVGSTLSERRLPKSVCPASEGQIPFQTALQQEIGRDSETIQHVATKWQQARPFDVEAMQLAGPMLGDENSTLVLVEACQPVRHSCNYSRDSKRPKYTISGAQYP